MSKKLEPEWVYQVEAGADTVVLGAVADHEEAEHRGWPQACAFVALVNSRGDIFVQRRSASKRLWPGRNTISASGHVEIGESFEQAARRELLEELGVEAGALRPLGAFQGETHCGPVYEAISDAPLIVNAAEVDAGRSRFVSEAELELQMRQPGQFTPSGFRALEIWLRCRRDCDVRGGEHA